MSYTNCPLTPESLNVGVSVNNFLNKLNHVAEGCFHNNFEGNPIGSNFLSDFQNALSPVFSALTAQAAVCASDSTQMQSFFTQLQSIESSIGKNIQICYAGSEGAGGLPEFAQCDSIAMGLTVLEYCSHETSCPFTLNSVPAWTGSNGLLNQIIAYYNPPAITFDTVVTLISPAGSGAFGAPNGELISSGNNWQVENGAEGIIGQATTPTQVPFQVNNNTIFTLDFTKSPVIVTNVTNSGFKATSVSDGNGGSVVSVVALPAVKFQNNTLYTINIASTDSNAFSTPVGGLSCSAGGCQIASGEGSGTIGDLNVIGPVTFNGMNKSDVVFSFTVTFNGSAITPVTQTNKQNVIVTANFNSNIYNVNITPAMILFSNTTSSEVDMVIDQAAFSQFSKGSYTNGAYPIGTNCTAVSPCAGTIGDLLSTGSEVKFMIGNKQVFTADFTKSPPVVQNPLPGYGATPLVNSNGGCTLAISYTVNVSFSLTGALSQIIQDTIVASNNIIAIPPTSMNINFAETIPSSIQNIFNKMMHFKMAANITISNIINISTVYSNEPLALGGASNLSVDTSASKFWNQSLSGTINVGFSSDKITKLALSGINLSMNDFPVGSFFSLSQTAVAKVQLLGYVPDATNPMNLDNTTITLASPVVMLNPLYTFTGIPRGIQKLVNSEGSSGDFNQALAGGEAGHVVHMVDAAGLKDQDADIGSTQFLKHERYTVGPNLSTNLNIGKVTNSGFSFTFALPTTVISSFVRLVNGSSIIITDSTQPAGKNQIIFNISGNITDANVTGSFYGQALLTGAAVVNTTGTPSITITGTMQPGIGPFFFTTAIAVQGNLLFQ